MFGERGPSASDPVLHLGGFLVLECDHLPQVLCFPFLLGWIASPCAPVLFFEVRDHILELFQRVRHHEHVVREAKV